MHVSMGFPCAWACAHVLDMLGAKAPLHASWQEMGWACTRGWFKAYVVSAEFVQGLPCDELQS